MTDRHDCSAPEFDEIAGIVADLIGLMDPWQKANLSTVRTAIAWLNEHDRPDRFLLMTTRDMMKAAE